MLRSASLCALAVAIAGCPAGRESMASPAAPTVDAAVYHTGPRAPRLILDAAALQGLAARAKQGTPAWKRLHSECKRIAEKPIAAEYEAFAWAGAVASLSLCYRATGERRWAEQALVYLGALLDDRHAVGDKKGGDAVVEHDSGYPIRTFGVYTALAYDWLHDAPGMTPELRAKVSRRLGAWLGWYRKKGYLNDFPISNYFFGYMTAAAFTGLALKGESPVGDEWLKEALSLLENKVVPRFGKDIKGGDFPEGWQYGELVAVELSMIVAAFRTGHDLDLRPRLPWLSEMVTYKTHALVPGGHAVYDNGTWGQRPARPAGNALLAAAAVLDGFDDERAAQARFLIRHSHPVDEAGWQQFLFERPRAPERDPRIGAPLSYALGGEGLTLMRSDWSATASWVSFQAGAQTAGDHQNADQGHFTVWRGDDGLIIDNGTSNGIGSLVHNVLFVDDNRRIMTYRLAQAPWGWDVRTSAFGDDGRIAVVAGELADAYSPSCRRADPPCRQRSLKKATRTLVYVRPSLLVVGDDDLLADGKDGITWAAHFRAEPRREGALTSVRVGGSRADLRTLWPANARFVVKKAPFQESGEGVWQGAEAHPDTWRLEVETPRGGETRRLVHWITIDRAEGAPPEAVPIGGAGLTGGRGKLPDGRMLAVLFADSPDGGRATFAAGGSAIVAGLAAGRRYQATAQREGERCQLAVQARPDGAATASPGGAIIVERACAD